MQAVAEALVMTDCLRANAPRTESEAEPARKEGKAEHADFEE
jgi:hypothetical protein